MTRIEMITSKQISNETFQKLLRTVSAVSEESSKDDEESRQLRNLMESLCLLRNDPNLDRELDRLTAPLLSPDRLCGLYTRLDSLRDNGIISESMRVELEELLTEQ